MKWYKEKTFKHMISLLTILLLFFQIGIWIVEGEIKDTSAIIVFIPGILVAFLFGYIFRNNP